MDQENQLNIDINTASQDSLTDLQGVGAHLAGKIIEARPFGSIDDLTSVRGISQNDVERLRPYLSISEEPPEPEDLDDLPPETEVPEVEELPDAEPAGEALPEDQELPDPDPEETIEETASQAEIFKEEEVDAPSADDPTEEEQQPLVEEGEPDEETPAEAASPQPSTVTRGGACGLILIGAFITLILAVAITLGILSSINQGHLDYASPSEIAALQSQTTTLSTQAQALAEDIDGMRTRIDNLESLSSQVTAMESEVNNMGEEIVLLQSEVAANKAAFDGLVAQLEEINEEIQILADQTERSDNFLEGLRSLMEELFPLKPELKETP